MRGRATPGRLTLNILPAIFAVVMWVVAIERRSFTVVERVPLLDPALPDSIAVIHDGPDTVEVSFTGTGASILLDQIAGSPAGVLPVVDPAGGLELPSAVEIQVAPSQLAWRGRPFSTLQAASFSPPVVILTLDRVAERIIPVRVTASGQVPSRVLAGTLQPSTVTARGPASLLERLDAVETEPLATDQPPARVGLVPAAGVTVEPSSVQAGLVTPVPVVRLADLSPAS